jgi:5-formyltetrahydrofolate cyclo-ligase
VRAARRLLVEADWRRASERICAQLQGIDALSSASNVALFWPMVERREVDLRPLDCWARERDQQLYYPCMTEDVWGFRLALTQRSLEANRWGFLQPGAHQPEPGPGGLDVIVTPALALTLGGKRLGYGAGFYDRVLPGFAPHATVIGTCFHAELADELPDEAHDWKVDWVVTDACATAVGRHSP